MAHRLDVTVQEADGVDALDGLQDLPAQTQGGADAEGSPAHTAPQVSQVTTLREQKRSNFTKKNKQFYLFKKKTRFLYPAAFTPTCSSITT